jgi:hypothetical protein
MILQQACRNFATFIDLDYQYISHYWQARVSLAPVSIWSQQMGRCRCQGRLLVLLLSLMLLGRFSCTLTCRVVRVKFFSNTPETYRMMNRAEEVFAGDENLIALPTCAYVFISCIMYVDYTLLRLDSWVSTTTVCPSSTELGFGEGIKGLQGFRRSVSTSESVPIWVLR